MSMDELKNSIKKEFSTTQSYDVANNRVDKPKEISNLFELEDISRRIEELQSQIKKISNDSSITEDSKLMKTQKISEEINNLKSRLTAGIHVDFSKIKIEISNSIINFLKPYGYTEEIIKQKLNNVEFHVTNERLNSGGLMSAVDHRIGIDYSCIEFDQNGNVIGIKEEQSEFIKYVLTHEFLHVCSNNSSKSHMNEALSEGLTDMFAVMITGNNEGKSKWYDMFAKIGVLFSNIVGIENIVTDYFSNLDTTPNIRGLFHDELSFLEFFQGSDEILKLKMAKADETTISTMQIELVNNIKENIFISFLKSQENKEKYIELFNNLFSEYGITCSLEEVKDESKNI